MKHNVFCFVEQEPCVLNIMDVDNTLITHS